MSKFERRNISCPICDTTQGRNMGVVPENLGLSMMRCGKCDVVYANPQPTDESLANYYSTGLERWSDQDLYRERRLPYINFYCKLIDGLRDQGYQIDNVLDIGCGIGELAYCIGGAFEIETAGVDISPADCEIAATRLDHVVCGDISNPTTVEFMQGKRFDLITMTDVLEHIAKPKKAIKNIRDLMKPKGLLLIDTGDVGGFGAKLASTKTPFLQDGGHIVGYSHRSMSYLLNQEGFQVIAFHNEKEIFDGMAESVSISRRLKRFFTSSPNMIVISQMI